MPALTKQEIKSLKERANQGSAEAQLQLGQHYERRDKMWKALKWYGCAAQQGELRANLQLDLLKKKIYEVYHEVLMYFYKTAPVIKSERQQQIVTALNNKLNANLEQLKAAPALGFNNAITQYVDQMVRDIKEALPNLNQDHDWFVYLMNCVKKLSNTIISFASFGNTNNFFSLEHTPVRLHYYDYIVEYTPPEERAILTNML